MSDVALFDAYLQVLAAAGLVDLDSSRWQLSRTSRSILEDEEHHIDYLDTQLDLVEKLGEALYLAQLIEQPES